MTKLRFGTCLKAAVWVMVFLVLHILPGFCLEPVIDARAAILFSISSGEVLYEKAAHVRYSSPLPLKLGLALGIVRCFSEQGYADAGDEITDYLLNEFFEKEGYNLTDILMSFASNETGQYTDEYKSDSDIENIEKGFMDIINRSYAEAGVNMRIQNRQQLRSVSILTSLADVSVVTSHLLEKTSQGFSLEEVPQTLDVIYVFDHALEAFNNMSEIKADWVLEAGSHYMVMAEKDGLKVLAAVYDSNQAQEDALSLLEHAFSEYRVIKLAARGETIKTLEVASTLQSIGLVPADDVVLGIDAEEEGTYEMLVKVYEPLEPPIKKGQIVGDLVVLLNGKEINCVELLSGNDVAQITFFHKLWRSFIHLVKVL